MTNSDDQWDNVVSQDVSRLTPMFDQALALEEQLQQELARSQEAREAFEDARGRRNLFKAFVWGRRLKNLSQIDVARTMRTSQSAISDIEKGLKDPRLSTLQRMARALGFELHVHLAVGPWIIIYGWRTRGLSYGSSVQPMRFEYQPDDTWITLIQRRHDRDYELHPSFHMDKLAVMPVSVRQDNFVPPKEVDRLKLSHAPASASTSI